MAELSPFPILDCSTIVRNSDVTTDGALKDFGKQFVSALTSSRACYIKNHGIENNLKEKYMAAHRTFFTQPTNIKKNFERKFGKFSGWVDMEKDMGPRNEVQAYFYLPSDDYGNWPNAEIEMYNKQMFAASTSIAGRLCDALSLGLGLEKSFIRSAHKLGLTGASGGYTLVRTNYYPPCSSDSKSGQTRYGAHTDVSTITLIIQDDIGGLEVELPGKGFVPVAPVPDTIVVIAGDLLQRWTSDTVKAANHRVIAPAEDSGRCMPRQSVLLFVVSDRDVKVKPTDGSDMYEPATSLDIFLEMSKQMGFTV